MNDINDYELIMLYHEKNELAELILFKRYEKLIRYLIKKYNKVIYKLNVNKNELYNDCLEAFNEALKKYNLFYKASFKTFVTLLVERKINNVIVFYSKDSLKKVNENLSLDYTYDDITLKDLIIDKKEKDPLNKILLDEKTNELTNIIIANLSSFELVVYGLLINDYSYMDISRITHKNYKQVANAIDRIRKKLKLKLCY